MITIKFTEKDFKQFKEIYELHKKSPEAVFDFQGAEYVSGYAKYLIQYFEGVFNTKRIVTSFELFMEQAPSFNFDLNEEQILMKALDDGYVKFVSKDQYQINPHYGEE